MRRAVDPARCPDTSLVGQAMSGFEQWMTVVAATPGPGEERLDQLREGDGIDGLDENEQAAWLLRVVVDYNRKPLGWQAYILVGRAGPECAGPLHWHRPPRDTVVADMDQARALADTTHRSVKVIYGVNGKPGKDDRPRRS
jgi:hypothetical protein